MVSAYLINLYLILITSWAYQYFNNHKYKYHIIKTWKNNLNGPVLKVKEVIVAQEVARRSNPN